MPLLGRQLLLAEMKKYLCVFAHEHVDFRLQELVSISQTLNHPIRFTEREYSNDSPFLVISASSDEAVKQISCRSVLLKSVVELWGEGSTYAEVSKSFSANKKDLESYFSEEVSFRIRMDCFNKKCTPDRQQDILEKLEFLPFNGKVNLKSPDVTVCVHEDYGPSSNLAPNQPFRIFLGRHICDGQRHLARHFSIKTRYFIGNTTMDPQLSLIMANQAKVTNSSLVFDPFVGSGSILIGCAHFGGHVLGADINSVLLHGRGRPSRSGTNQKWRSSDESILSNLVQYGLQSKYLDAVVADAAQLVWRGEELFDAIVTDPPYGVREGARKVGTGKTSVNPVPPENQEGHVSAVCSYVLSDVYQDLLHFAARFLVLGGRLVYWLPVVQHEYDPSLVPQHPCLGLVANSEQQLSGSISRRLVTMEKVKKYIDMSTATSHGVPDDFRAKYFKYSGVKLKGSGSVSVDSSTPRTTQVSAVDESSTPRTTQVSAVDDSSTPHTTQASAVGDSSTPHTTQVSAVDSSTLHTTQVSAVDESSTPCMTQVSAVDSSTPRTTQVSASDIDTKQDNRISSVLLPDKNS